MYLQVLCEIKMDRATTAEFNRPLLTAAFISMSLFAVIKLVFCRERHGARLYSAPIILNVKNDACNGQFRYRVKSSLSVNVRSACNARAVCVQRSSVESMNPERLGSDEGDEGGQCRKRDDGQEW